MGMDKKGFAELIQNSIDEFNEIRLQTKNIINDLYLVSKTEDISKNSKYKYYKYMEKLVFSKVSRLYKALSVPAYSRILSMNDDEIVNYRSEKVDEISNEINRLMFSLEGAKNDVEKTFIKEKVESLVEEQSMLKKLEIVELKEYIITKLRLDVENVDSGSNVYEETKVLENITKTEEILSKFISMLNEYRILEKEIKTIRGEQIIIYNDMLSSNIKADMSIDELFSEESLTKLQSKIAIVLEEVSNVEVKIKMMFSPKTQNAYKKLKDSEYKYDVEVKTLPYDEKALEVFEEILPIRIYELAKLQNEEWIMLNKKIFKTVDVNSRLANLCMEIDDTKLKIDTEIRNVYKGIYCDSNIFKPISSRASGRFEYSLGAKDSLGSFIDFGIWPTAEQISSLKLSLKLNKIEAEKSIIYAEQIKERFSRLYNDYLNDKKKELANLENKMIDLVGNWNNPIILSIINEM